MQFFGELGQHLGYSTLMPKRKASPAKSRASQKLYDTVVKSNLEQASIVEELDLSIGTSPLKPRERSHERLSPSSGKDDTPQKEIPVSMRSPRAEDLHGAIMATEVPMEKEELRIGMEAGPKDPYALRGGLLP